MGDQTAHIAAEDALQELAGGRPLDLVFSQAGEEHEGAVLGLMADRPLDHNVELVPFLGKLAPIATSPFRIALATGAEIVFIFGFKGVNNSYEFFARRPLSPPQAGLPREAAVYHFACEYARHLENAVVLDTADPAEAAWYVAYLADRPDQQERLRTGARATARLFTWERVIDQLLARVRVLAAAQD